jgi:hypothetical protein
VPPEAESPDFRGERESVKGTHGGNDHPVRKEAQTMASRKGRRTRGSYRAYFTTRSGRRVYASDYGHKAWPIG